MDGKRIVGQLPSSFVGEGVVDEIDQRSQCGYLDDLYTAGASHDSRRGGSTRSRQADQRPPINSGRYPATRHHDIEGAGRVPIPRFEQNNLSTGPLQCALEHGGQEIRLDGQAQLLGVWL